MKIIDLLNKIANGEEVPQMVSYEGKKYHIDELDHFYVNDDKKALLEYIFDYLNDFDALMTEIEIIEEEKKIPKKLKIQNETIGNAYITNAQGTKCYLTKHSKMIAEKINEIIDYIEKENK